MDTIPTSRAQRELPELIHRAAAGETIVLEAPSGERVKLSPLPDEKGDRIPGLLKELLTVPVRLFEPMSEEELDRYSGKQS